MIYPPSLQPTTSCEYYLFCTHTQLNDSVFEEGVNLDRCPPPSLKKNPKTT